MVSFAGNFVAFFTFNKCFKQDW